MSLHKRLFVPLALTVVLLVSCGKNGEKENPSPDQTESDSTTHTRLGISVEEWIAENGPDPSTPWGVSELNRAIQVIQSIRRTGTHGLPRLGGNGSGKEVFARLISEENLQQLTPDSASLEEKMGPLGQFMTVETQIYMVYAGAMMGGEGYTDEMIELMSFLLTTESHFMKVLQAYLKTVTPEQRETVSFKTGMKQVQDGLTQSLEGIITVLRDKGVFSQAQLERLATSFQTLGPALIAGLDESYQQQLQSKAVLTLEATDNEKIGQALRAAFPNIEAAK
ncbi:MAG: hypothetical protein KDD67_15450 [Ignavibacteriae bacterium]|nr:hypothetical protein [Ignavibacteriota bacterium]MCB9215782.1 hypothetical protein [Ignavibacteria bacterium]